MHLYKRNLGDYAKDTGHLEMAEHGAYNLMIDWSYATEKPLPADDEQLFRICRARTRTEKQTALAMRAEFFVQTDDGWTHKRIQRELAEYADGGDGHAYASFCREWKRKGLARQKRPAFNEWLANREKYQTMINSDHQTIIKRSSNDDRRRSSNDDPTKNQEPRTKNHTPLPSSTDELIDPMLMALTERAAKFSKGNQLGLELPAEFVAWWWRLRESSDWLTTSGRQIAASEKARWHDLINLAQSMQSSGEFARFVDGLKKNNAPAQSAPPEPELPVDFRLVAQRALGWENILPEVTWATMDASAKRAIRAAWAGLSEAERTALQQEAEGKNHE